jgi:hypothetical protein
LRGFSFDTTSNNSGVNTHTGNINPNLYPFDSVNILIPELNIQGYAPTNYNDSYSFVVPIDNISGALLTSDQSDFNQILEYQTAITLNQINVSLMGRNSQALSLNGSEWSMVWLVTQDC